ncbi:HD domain-containing protein [Deinococcus rubellus]|uniref:HD-GYP domain-containing protein n=1 Tax=Deinococcus rubellus TaxID=1889240 RepID=A0ABY5YKY1_9DEIO|nr:HD-GYP domain-containing protein [Deinococcus rubellus]UWX65356.1 HD-GYP domain-containing protein [Deinococcus rubellus]
MNSEISPTTFPPALLDSRDLTAQNVLTLIHIALEAADLGAGVVPTLDTLISHTAAVGAAYFQIGAQVAPQLGTQPGLVQPTPLIYQVRAAAGELPDTPGMQAIAAHGLPADTPLMQALYSRRTPMFFDDVAKQPQTAGFAELGVASLAAAPVLGMRGELLGAFLMHTFVAHAWNEEEVRLFSSVVGTIAALTARLAAEEQVTSAREAALRALGLALETRDRETQGHTDRVTLMASQLAAQFKLSHTEAQALRWGAYLHDIGKIAIADSILHKPGKLSEEEFALMRDHAVFGHNFASALGFLPPASLAVVAQHHERWDGQGYPGGLRGEEIHLLARIFALCDVYDALVSVRPYKPAWTPEEACAEIARQSGRHFDPQVTAAFFELLAAQTMAAASD